MKLTEKKRSETQHFQGRIIRVHEDEVLLENGKTATREVVEHPGGVAVVAVTAQDEVLLVRQYRYPYGEALLEIPAGKLEPGEDPFEAAVREQREETGTTGTQYHFLGKLYPSPGYCSEVIRIWACRVDTQGALSLDDDEFLELVKIPIEQAVSMVINDELPDAKTQTGILKADLLRKQGKL